MVLVGGEVEVEPVTVFGVELVVVDRVELSEISLCVVVDEDKLNNVPCTCFILKYKR